LPDSFSSRMISVLDSGFAPAYRKSGRSFSRRGCAASLLSPVIMAIFFPFSLRLLTNELAASLICRPRLKYYGPAPARLQRLAPPHFDAPLKCFFVVLLSSNVHFPLPPQADRR